MDEFEMEMRIGELEDELDQLRQENSLLRDALKRKQTESVRYGLLVYCNDNMQYKGGDNDVALLLLRAVNFIHDNTYECVRIYDYERNEFVLDYWRE